MARVLLVIAGLGAGLLVAELVIRVVAWNDPELGARMRHLTDSGSGIGFRWQGHPFLPFVGKQSHDYVVQRDDVWAGFEVRGVNNAHGFRAHEFPTAKGPDDVHVLCFGGSTTWGAIADSNATTWPGLLEQRLARRYPDKNVKVFNFGISTATTAFSVVTLSTIGVHLDPDLVIVYHGATDQEPIRRADFKTDHSHYFKDFDAEWLGVRRSMPAWTLGSYTVAYITGRLDEAMQVNSLMFYVTRRGFDSVGGDVNAAERMLPNLRTMHSVAAGAGAPIVFSTFQLYDEELDPRLNPTLRAFFEENDFAYVDQAALIPDLDREINIDDCHFTRDGREMVADNFFAFVDANRLLEPPR